jgi:hypothetical protein
MANTNKPMVDLPFWEDLNQPPTASSALSCITTVEEGSDRFIYYLVGSLFYRFDTVAETWQLLATIPTAPVGAVSMRYTKRRGYHGRVLSAGSTTVRLAGVRGNLLNGHTVRILQGTGKGQERVLTYVGETIHEWGMATAAAANLITDGLKKWKINQWAGYMVAITFGTDATQYKKILYNDTTTLYVSDANLMPQDPWNNQPFLAIAPYAVPAAGSHFQIMSQDYTVPSWTVTPDYTSFFTTLSGGIYVMSGAAAAPWMTFQYYDVLHDSWQAKTCNQGLLAASIGATDLQIERTGKTGSALLTNVGTVSTSGRVLTDTGLALTVDRWRNHRILITGGTTGIGQTRRIVSNTATGFTLAKAWDIDPSGTITYEVWPDFNRLYAIGGGTASMLAYDPENDFWMGGQAFDDGVAATIACKFSDWTPFGVTTGTRIALGVTALTATPIAAGSGYAIGDTFSFVTGAGAGAKGRVTGITTSGAVTSVELIDSGTTTGYTVATSGAVTNIVGSGTSMTVAVASVGVTANITLSTASWLKQGDSVTFSGCTEGAWNAAHTILGVSSVTASTTVFSVATTATANMTATLTQAATTICDCTKNWVVNEHVGRIVHANLAGLGAASTPRWITANTANTLTVATITTPLVNGTGKYQIYDAKPFGTEEQRRETVMERDGHATGGSTTTLIDSTKAWIPNMWVGYKMKIEAGTGYGTGLITITANSATQLTFASIGVTPDATTRYEIADAWGIATAAGASSLTDSTKNYAVNQFNGKRFKFTAGTLAGTETATTANTATAFTITGTPDTTSAYAILAVPAHGAGLGFVWTWGATDNDKKKNMYRFRGGGSGGMDIYDIPRERWLVSHFYQGQDELFTTGSSYAYAGGDIIYATRSVANTPPRVLQYEMNTNRLIGQATVPWWQGTATIGGFLEVVDSPTDGYSYLYMMQNTGSLFSRSNIF